MVEALIDNPPWARACCWWGFDLLVCGAKLSWPCFGLRISQSSSAPGWSMLPGAILCSPVCQPVCAPHTSIPHAPSLQARPARESYICASVVSGWEAPRDHSGKERPGPLSPELGPKSRCVPFPSRHSYIQTCRFTFDVGQTQGAKKSSLIKAFNSSWTRGKAHWWFKHQSGLSGERGRDSERVSWCRSVSVLTFVSRLPFNTKTSENCWVCRLTR